MRRSTRSLINFHSKSMHSMNIHSVTKVTCGEVMGRDIEGRYRVLKFEFNDGQEFDITLFAENKESLQFTITKEEKI